MAIGDKYQLRDKQDYRGQLCLNVYYYVQTEGTEGAESLANAFFQDVVSAVRPLQVDNLSHTGIEVINLDNLSDFYELMPTANNAGTISTEMDAIFMAYSFKLVRTSRAVRNGYKRVAGVAVADVSDGDVDTAAYTRLQAAADAMAANIQYSTDSAIFKPVIMKKTGTSPNIVYTAYDISDVTYSQTFTTQSSRKYGRGA